MGGDCCVAMFATNYVYSGLSAWISVNSRDTFCYPCTFIEKHDCTILLAQFPSTNPAPTIVDARSHMLRACARVRNYFVFVRHGLSNIALGIIDQRNRALASRWRIYTARLYNSAFSNRMQNKNIHYWYSNGGLPCRRDVEHEVYTRTS